MCIPYISYPLSVSQMYCVSILEISRELKVNYVLLFCRITTGSHSSVNVLSIHLHFRTNGSSSCSRSNNETAAVVYVPIHRYTSTPHPTKSAVKIYTPCNISPPLRSGNRVADMKPRPPYLHTR